MESKPYRGAEEMLSSIKPTLVMTLPALYERLTTPPLSEVVSNYEFEEAIHDFLHRMHGELFKRETQVNYE